MAKEAVFTLKLEAELRNEFMDATKKAHCPASQVIREFMREFIQRQQDARQYDEYLRQKVEVSRISMRAGLGKSNDKVEAEFATRRAQAENQG